MASDALNYLAHRPVNVHVEVWRTILNYVEANKQLDGAPTLANNISTENAQRILGR